MELNFSKKISALRNMKAMGYPITLMAFVIILLVLFLAIARFLSASINTAISSPDEAQIQAQLTHINIDDYNSVRQKLHLPILTPSATTTVTEMFEEPTTTLSTIPSVATKSTLTLAIFNSTKKTGIAGLVKNDMVAAGFTVATVGNKTPQEPETLVQIKERVQASPELLDAVLAIVKKHFTIGEPRILEDTSPYDIIITLGAR